MKTKHLLPPLLALCMSAATSQAATIVYNFNDTIAYAANLGTGSPVTSNGFSGDGITVSNWTASSPVRTIGIQGGQVRALKSTDTDTHQFTLTIPDLAGGTLDLTSLAFAFGEVGPDNGAPTWTVSSNLAGGTITPNTANAIGTTNDITASANMALAGTFTGITSGSITFTLTDAAQGNNLNTTMYTWIDNVVLTGTLNPAIPEPSAALLGSLGLMMILRRRR